MRRIVVLLYGTLVSGMSEENRRRVDNILTRPPGLTVDEMPDIPIPAWMDIDDIPPEMRPEW